jgi:hypothetical protein
MVSWYTYIPSISNAAGKSSNDPSTACFSGSLISMMSCVYIYVYVYVYVYVYIYVYIYVYVYVYVYRVLYVDKQKNWSQLDNTWFWLHLGVCIRNRTKGTT